MARINNLNIWQRFRVNLLWGMCWLYSLMPHWFIFGVIARGVKFILYRIIRYRKHVVDSNLKMVYPDKSDEEREQIADRFYTILSEIILSTLVLCNGRKAKKIIGIERCEEGEGPEGLRRLYNHVIGGSWIALSGHIGLYEYQLFWATYSGQDLLAVYHPLRNPVVDELFLRLRRHKGVIPMPAREVLLYTIKNKFSPNGNDFSVGLIADQNATPPKDGHWYKFLGIGTSFFDGGEKMALRSGMPVTFIYQKRTGRGRYEMHFEPIWDGKEEVAVHEITQRYVTLLEQKINEAPEMWLWSHKRWKWKREL